MRYSPTQIAAYKAIVASARRKAKNRKDRQLLSKMVAQPPIGPRYPVKVIYRREPISND